MRVCACSASIALHDCTGSSCARQQQQQPAELPAASVGAAAAKSRLRQPLCKLAAARRPLPRAAGAAAAGCKSHAPASRPVQPAAALLRLKLLPCAQQLLRCASQLLRSAHRSKSDICALAARAASFLPHAVAANLPEMSGGGSWRVGEEVGEGRRRVSDQHGCPAGGSLEQTSAARCGPPPLPGVRSAASC